MALLKNDANTLCRIAIVNADKCKPKVPNPHFICVTQLTRSEMSSRVQEVL